MGCLTIVKLNAEPRPATFATEENAAMSLQQRMRREAESIVKLAH